MACEYGNSKSRLPADVASRWLRLLFTREFGFKESMILWDGLFAMDSTLNLANWICVAMLVRIRNHCTYEWCDFISHILNYSFSNTGRLQ
jgi:TBC1 domain family protein 5